MSMSPLELVLEIRPESRIHVVDVRERARAVHGDALEGFDHCLYNSPHTTAGYLPQSLGVRLAANPQRVRPYLDLFQAMFPPDAGYSHDKLDLRSDLAPSQRLVEPTNADSHLTFMGSGLHACVSYPTRRPGPVYFIDLDGVQAAGKPRRRATTLVGYNREVEVARRTIEVPVSSHPIEAINLKDPRLGLFAQVAELITRHGVQKGRVRLQLGRAEQHASLTVNEYETLLMQHDLAEVLRDPLRFAKEKARHAWNDPFAVPGKALEYAKYDLVQALNRLVDSLGARAACLERIVARALEVPASRFLRMKRSVDLLVSDAGRAGGAVVEGTYQAPIMVQWRRPAQPVRLVDVSLVRFE
jgi:thiamine phosphate synthase YjbQ (UPF0047 family)